MVVDMSAVTCDRMADKVVDELNWSASSEGGLSDSDMSACTEVREGMTARWLRWELLYMCAEVRDSASHSTASDDVTMSNNATPVCRWPNFGGWAVDALYGRHLGVVGITATCDRERMHP